MVKYVIICLNYKYSYELQTNSHIDLCPDHNPKSKTFLYFYFLSFNIQSNLPMKPSIVTIKSDLFGLHIQVQIICIKKNWDKTLLVFKQVTLIKREECIQPFVIHKYRDLLCTSEIFLFILNVQ